LEEGIETICESAFGECSELLQVAIPASVKSLEVNSFPANVVLLVYENSDAHTFAESNGLLYVLYDGKTEPEIITQNGITYVIKDEKAVAIDCDDEVTEVTVPLVVEGYPVVLKETFKECVYLQKVILPEGLTEIGDHLFDGCGNLTTVNIPSTVTRIGEYAFQRTTALTSIDIPDSVTEIGNGAFYVCYITEVELPSGLESLPNSAFSWTALEKITVPGTVKSIGASCFSTCNNLKTVVLEEGIETICESAFGECSELLQVVIPASIKSLEVNSFPANVMLIVYEDSVAEEFVKANKDNLLYFVLQKTENPEIAYGASITGTATYLDGSKASGATVEILYDDGTVKESVETDSSGDYEFTYAEVGTYTIRVTDGNGNSASENIAVTRMNAFDVFVMGDTNLKLKKGYTVSGTYAEGSATVSLTDTEGNVIMSTTAEGNFSFSNVQNGTYIITVKGSNFSGSAEVTVYGENVSATIDISSLAATISGKTYVADRNDSETIRNWVQVTLYNKEGVAIAQCKSDTEGTYRFDNVPTGEYTVVAETSELRPDKKWYYYRSHKLTGFAYIEMDGSDVNEDIILYEETEAGGEISGQVVYGDDGIISEVILKNVFHAEIAKCTTGSNGNYTFKNVKDGIWAKSVSAAHCLISTAFCSAAKAPLCSSMLIS